MKEKIIIWLRVALVLLLIIGGIRTILFPWIFPFQVAGVELRGASSCGGGSSRTVELSRGEVHLFLLCYNLAAYDGEVVADSCESDYCFVVHMTNGSRGEIRDSHFSSAQIRVGSANSNRDFWLKSNILDWYALELVEKYDLTDS